MPLANFYIRDQDLVDPDSFQNLTREWSETAGIESKHFSINVTSGFLQFGHPYPICINLFLATFWNDGDIRKIQLCLLLATAKHLRVTTDKILIMTTMLHSGHVAEGGKIIEWIY